MLRRRAAIVGVLGVSAWSRAPAQPASKAPRIGVLEGWPADVFPGRYAAFKEGLRAARPAERDDAQFVYRTANGRLGDLPALAAELAMLKVDVIFAGTTPAAVAARDATREIPIVFAVVADPVGTKLVASLARPGGNVTGMTTINVDVIPKRLQLFRELLNGRLSRVVLVFSPGDPSNVIAARSSQDAGRALGIDITLAPVTGPQDIDRTFAGLAAQGTVDGIVVSAGVLTDSHARRITELAAGARVPTMYSAPEFVDLGGLISYSASFSDNYRRAAAYVDRILRGARPADLPVEQSRELELVVNRRAATALGLTIPRSLLLQARVVE